MGLDLTSLRFLVDAHASGTSFEHTVTLGRQSLFVDPDSLAALSTTIGHPMTAADARALLEEGEGFCEPFLGRLGAARVLPLDVSPYQRASIVHDMNLPVPDSLHQSCSALIDGGTLEHVFDFPRAIRNCMEMIRVGGHFLSLTPTNNFMGHGFFQFSPELFYRVFSRDNGFVVERMLIFEEYGAAPRFFEVPDPAAVGRRVPLVNRHPTTLLVRARRIAAVPIFATIPQQSDYVPLWQHTTGGAIHHDARHHVAATSRFARAAWKTARPWIPAWLLEGLRGMRRGPDAFDRRLYRRVSL